MISAKFNSSNISTESFLQSEWLETNGLGGWASSTLSGCNTRRYHGLLIAAENSPSNRMAILSKLDETIVVHGKEYELGVNNYGDVVHPAGHQYLKSFSKYLFPQWIYEAGDIQVRKSLLMVHGENTTIIKYEITKSPSSFVLKLLPLFSVRGYHQLMRMNESVNRNFQEENGEYLFRFYEGTPQFLIHLPGSQFQLNPDWYYHFNYQVEKSRGLDFEEDLFSPGKMSIEAKEGDALYIILSIEKKPFRNAILLFETEVERRQALIRKEKDPYVQQLILAADQFIVKRSDDLKTIIAGYHWFTDWSRDAMIALPGLCIATRRFKDARKILEAFARSVDEGMLPNRFQDNGDKPEYNNVDGTLWYFIAIYHYFKATNDIEFVLGELLPVLKQIIESHFHGTRYNIHVDDDGLLFAGESGVQLTWMDAKLGDWVVTPRTGKPVEIQALWYNALCIYSEFLRLNNEQYESERMSKEASRVKKTFAEKFWYEEGGFLADLIDEQGQADHSLRPNQLFAISLPFQLFNSEKSKSVFRAVEQNLYTTRGLRSLSPHDPRFIGQYEGDPWHRDAAYHQGTVWSWLLGPYIDAVFRTNGSAAALIKAKKIFDSFKPHLNEAGLGTISEIFDANAPFTPRGCIAQAWSVGEILRVIKEYKLGFVASSRMQEVRELL